MSYGGADADLTHSVVRLLELASGGKASSRDVGRHLAAAGLLAPLKLRYAGLFNFLQRHDDLFVLELPAERGVLEYEVQLVDRLAELS